MFEQFVIDTIILANIFLIHVKEVKSIISWHDIGLINRTYLVYKKSNNQGQILIF